MPTKATSYRFSEEADAMVDRLAEHLGVNRTAILEIAIRKLYRAEIEPDPAPRKKAKTPGKTA